MADIINFVDENGVDWRAEVGKVYAKITGDFYDEHETPADDIIDEYMTCYGNAAELALELEDRLDDVFSGCTTVEDCKDALRQYFQW